MLQPKHLRTVLPSVLLALACALCGRLSAAQDKAAPALEGYITTVRGFHDFDVNGARISTSSSTRYGLIGNKSVTDEGGLRGAVAPGSYVQIIGDSSETGISAREVLFARDWNKTVDGFGVIDRVIGAGPEPVFRADGYRIRIASTTEIKFEGGLASVADVGTSTWIKYEGRRGAGGDLMAPRVTFIKPRPGKVVPPPADRLPTQPSLINANGELMSLHAKVRLGDFAGPCGLHKVVMDQAMQERVRRVGMKVIPEYQKHLPDDSPWKIHFNIYVVDEAIYREDIECSLGLILVPRQVVERLANDDQLAAIMSNAMAFTLMMQEATVRATAVEKAAVVAGEIAIVAYPVYGLPAYWVVEQAEQIKMREQAGRIAMTLMADAGYDPRQAPEAWRLLGPKKMPKDPGQLRYPSRAAYQLSFLNAEGKGPQPNSIAQ